MKHKNSARALSALAAVLALGVAGLAVQAQTPAPAPSTPPYGPGPGMVRMSSGMDSMDGMTEGRFVRALDAINTAELDVAKYVVNRTKDPTVHAFAQRMIDDHSTTAVKLEAATRGTNLRPAPRDQETNLMSRHVIDMLSSESGTQLDNDFMRVQVPGHQHELALLKWEQENGQNLGLKALATNLAPTVQQHLSLAQNYLAAHNLTPYSPPMTNPVPGNVNPNNNNSGNGTSNNPASSSNGTSPGQNSPSGAQPAPGATPTPSAPFSNGTAPPASSASPSAAPAPSSSPRP